MYNNLIINTSDNVFEPEVYCHNLHFYHNRLVNGHAFISVTEVGGGPIFLYGNTGLSDPDCEDGWAIYKISNKQRTMDRPFYIFNNSWYVDFYNNRKTFDHDPRGLGAMLTAGTEIYLMIDQNE